MTPDLRRRWTRALDAFARPELRLLGRRVCSFHVCGLTGLVLGASLGMTLAVQTGLSPRILGLLVFTSTVTFVVLALGMKVLTGDENLVYYHHEIAIVAVAAATLRLLGEPVLPYLDLVVLGVGLFLACGRIGCLMVGCCHGRPHPWGVAYRPEHAATGFPSHLVGVRLFPMQAVESLFVFTAVATGSVLVLRGRPGEALVVYVFAYGAARFLFELARGDDDRPYFASFSEAQWTSIVLMVSGLAVGLSGWPPGGGLPLLPLQIAATVLVVAVMVAVVVKRRLDPVPRFALLHPRHVAEVATALRDLPATAPLELAAAAPAGVHLFETSGGLRLSQGRLDDATDHYCLSHAGPPMATATAEVAADLVLRLRPRDGPGELVPGSPGVFHLLVPRPAPPSP